MHPNSTEARTFPDCSTVEVYYLSALIDCRQCERCATPDGQELCRSAQKGRKTEKFTQNFFANGRPNPGPAQSIKTETGVRSERPFYRSLFSEMGLLHHHLRLDRLWQKEDPLRCSASQEIREKVVRFLPSLNYRRRRSSINPPTARTPRLAGSGVGTVLPCPVTCGPPSRSILSITGPV